MKAIVKRTYVLELDEAEFRAVIYGLERYHTYLYESPGSRPPEPNATTPRLLEQLRALKPVLVAAPEGGER